MIILPMKHVPFKSSPIATLGIELEFQIIDPITYDLIAHAKDLMRHIPKDSKIIKPEITQSMIEINSSIHNSVDTLYQELLEIREVLLKEGNLIGYRICGGGTHPFQKWAERKIFPTKRFKNLSRQYQYLSKRATVFGEHVHIGCRNSEEALYLTHALARYVPHFVALSASSPFYENYDSGYDTSRVTVFDGFPLTGVIPYLLDWNQFSIYFYKMRKLKIASSMKDYHWDIRPKPEFGTVEIRVCDTPLTIEKAVSIAAYIQAIAYYILKTRSVVINEDLYYLYKYNRFQASRYGFNGIFINPFTLKKILISEDILATISNIEKYSDELGGTDFLSLIKLDTINKINDAKILRDLYKKLKSFNKVVQEQCFMWSTKSNIKK